MTNVSWLLVAKWVTRLLLTVVVGLTGFALTVLIVLPRATHGTALTVLTGSMTPGIPVGSIVVVRPVDPGTLHVGDVATYQKAADPKLGRAQPEYITHRIIKIDTSKTPTMFTFKGDANRGADIFPVPASAIHGKVWFHVPYLGGIRDALHTRNGLAGAGMVLLGAYAAFQFVAVARDRRRRRADPSGASKSQLALAPLRGDEVMIRAEVPLKNLDGLTPRVFALLLRGACEPVGRHARHCTVVIAEDPARVQKTLALLRQFDSTKVETSTNGGASLARPMSLETVGALGG